MRYSLPNNRQSIFHRGLSSGKNRKDFQFFSKTSPFLPEFLDKVSSCGCLESLNPCPFALKILKNEKLEQAELLYEKIKKKAQQNRNETNPHSKQKEIKMKQQHKILQPHFRSLLKVIDCANTQPVFQILRHAKCQYLTFWIYAKLCQQWPTFQDFTQNVREFAYSSRMDIDMQSKDTQTKLKELYLSKLASISEDDYMLVVTSFFKKQNIAVKMAALFLVKGRQRKNYQILKAAIDSE